MHACCTQQSWHCWLPFLSGQTPELQVDVFGWFWVQAGVGFETNGFPQRNELRKAVFVKEAPTSGKIHTG